MKVFSVTELTVAIKNLLEPQFREVSIQGEISNFKLQGSGHLYFSLKDSGSQIQAALFRGNAASLDRMPKDGDQVIAKGSVSLYQPRGQYQIVVRELSFLGQGELLLKLQQLKNTLNARGWFDKSFKKPLPKFPKKIGVVTSPTGAVIQDILNVLTQRFSGFHVLLNPVKVQGAGSSLEIAKAIKDFNTHEMVDVIIVGRGGGSIEDLWAFNEEIVAKAIFESKIPIVSAVGHETDVTIADFVADIRAPTPSAAAVMVVAEKANILKFLQNTREFISQRITYQVRQSKQHIEAVKKHPLFSSPKNYLCQPMQQLDDLRSDLDMSIERLLSSRAQLITNAKQRLALLNPSTHLKMLQEKLSPYRDRNFSALSSILREKKKSFANLCSHLRSLNPKNILKKGYSLVTTPEGTVICSAKELDTNQPFNLLLHDGRIEATVNEIETYDTESSFL